MERTLAEGTQYNGYLYNINIQKTKEVAPPVISLIRFTMEEERPALPTYISFSRWMLFNGEKNSAKGDL